MIGWSTAAGGPRARRARPAPCASWRSAAIGPRASATGASRWRSGSRPPGFATPRSGPSARWPPRCGRPRPLDRGRQPVLRCVMRRQLEEDQARALGEALRHAPPGAMLPRTAAGDRRALGDCLASPPAWAAGPSRAPCRTSTGSGRRLVLVTVQRPVGDGRWTASRKARHRGTRRVGLVGR